jgi:hypothetical protein
VALFACEGFAAELEKNAFEFGHIYLVGSRKLEVDSEEKSKAPW